MLCKGGRRIAPGGFMIKPKSSHPVFVSLRPAPLYKTLVSTHLLFSLSFSRCVLRDPDKIVKIIFYQTPLSPPAIAIALSADPLPPHTCGGEGIYRQYYKKKKFIITSFKKYYKKSWYFGITLSSTRMWGERVAGRSDAKTGGERGDS